MGNFEIERVEPEVLPVIREMGYLQRVQLPDVVIPPDSEENFRAEAAVIGQQDVGQVSAIFHNNRVKVLSALQAVLKHLFEKYDLPTEGGMDVGCGATGGMVNYLAAPFIQGNRWMQIDANANAVARNRSGHPEAQVMQGSYHFLQDDLGLRGNMNIITGLSSLDATHHVARVVDQIKTALRDGGYFLHIQDVRPGLGVSIRELRAMGQPEPLIGEVIGNADPLTGGLISAHTNTEGILSVGELTRRQLDRAVDEVGGLEVLESTWMCATGKPSTEEFGIYYMNAHIPDPATLQASCVVSLVRKTG